ncbi:MAG TPA: hypothetical protein DCX46_13145 [Bacteroidetes bacterium]|nr:MAG: hypothetical protein A2X68_04085 [Ignavibacteria bacterium GWC2_56_12]HAV24405.1 hypothetical protein [Bacteroidota bacterium]
MQRWSSIVLTLLLIASAVFAQGTVTTSGPGRPSSIIVPELSGEKARFVNLVRHSPVRRPRVGLVLSGGGARGIASIGVFRALERHAITPDLVVGTSIGSIVGGLFATGYTTANLEKLALETDWAEVLNYNDDARRRDMFLDQKLADDRSLLVLRFDGFVPIIPAAFSTGQRLTNFLNLLVLQGTYHPKTNFDDLRVPFRAMTTDLISGKPYIFKDGDLSQALRASVAVPLLFSPVRLGDKELMDGGLLSNMPVDVARSEGMDIVVVVDVTSPLRPDSLVNAPWEVGEQIMGIMMQAANREALRQADIVITPELGGHLSSEFSGLESLIDAGDAATEKVLAKFDSLFESRSAAMFRAHSGAAHPQCTIVYDTTVFQTPHRTALDALTHRDTVEDCDLRRVVTGLYGSGDFESVAAEIWPQVDGDRIVMRGVRHPVVRGVDFEGVQEVSVDSLLEIASPILGRPMNAQTVTGVFENILAKYREAGLSLAEIRSVSFDSLTGRARIVIDEGIINLMTIRGTKKTKDYVLWRELPFKAGDVFRVAKVAEGLSNLASTNLFEQASITVEREGEEDRRRVIVINARERYTELIRLGLYVNNERGIQPSVDMRDENFLGIGAELGLRAFGGTRNESYIAEFKAVRIFNSYLTSSLRAYMISRDINTFTDATGLREDRFNRVRTGEIREVRRGGSLSFGTQLERLGNVTVEGRLERHQVYNIYNEPVVNQSYDISSIRFGTRVDTEDRYPFPTEGIDFQFMYETALVKTPGSVGFTKMLLTYETVRTFAGSHSFRPKFTLGLGDEAVPTSEQFTLGGWESFFGYREDNARGRQLFSASLEYLYRLPFKVYFDAYATVRYDIGSIWLRPEEIRLIDLKHAVGVGLAFDTPVGPATFALGRSFFLRKDLLEKPVSLGPLLAYFSIGLRLN